MSATGGNSTIERLEEKVKARGGRVVESFTIKTKGKNFIRRMAKKIVNSNFFNK